MTEKAGKEKKEKRGKRRRHLLDLVRRRFDFGKQLCIHPDPRTALVNSDRDLNRQRYTAQRNGLIILTLAFVNV